MAETKKTMAEWFAYLDSETRDFTLAEFMGLMLFHLRQHAAKTSTLAQDQRDGVQHVEAMVGSLDEFMAGANPEYRAIADGRTRPVVPALEEQNG